MCWQMRTGLIEDGKEYEKERNARKGDGEADEICKGKGGGVSTQVV